MPSSQAWSCSRCGAQVAPADWTYEICPRCLVAEDYSEGPTEPITPAASPLTHTPGDPSSPEQIGPYKILRRLGEGGMGVVYLAEQEEPIRRQVALKLIKLGMDTRQVLARFEAERQALAMMNHPSIAHVYDAGVTDQGRPFFAMEYVEGEPITAYCDRQCLSTDERLALFMQICDGVQHAHQKGIIHRDLKPANVLVTLQDDQPVPKIIDFGVAKATEQRLTEQTMFTQQGMMIGTPEYMSPEQAGLTGFDVDTRTDVYSLGVLLYELLVGALPFESKDLRRAGFDEIRRIIREETPHKPSTRLSTLGEQSEQVARRRSADRRTLIHECRGDLDWITMKALEKDRARRYASPTELAADVKRHLTHEPVQASPPGTVYRVRKFVRRHSVGVFAASVVLLALVGGLTASVWGLVRVTQAEAVARQEAETATQLSEFMIDLFRVPDPGESRGNSVTVREVLDKGAESLENKLGDQPLVKARMLDTMGEVFLNLGVFERARDLLEQALEIQQSVLGPEDRVIALTLSKLSLASWWWYSGDRALELGFQALDMARKTMPPDDPDLARILNVVGFYCSVRMRVEEADEYLAESIEIWKKHPDLNDRDEHYAYANYARLLGRQGKMEQGLPVLRRAVQICEDSQGADSPDCISDLISLAEFLHGTGDTEQGIEVYTRALETGDRVFPADYTNQINAYVILARFYYFQYGDAQKAIELLERGLARHDDEVGADQPKAAEIVWALARILANQGDLERARPLFERAVAQKKERFKDNERAASRGAFYEACYRALMGERDAAILALRKAVELGYSTKKAAADDDLQSLHGDPEFDTIVGADTGDGTELER